MSRSISIRLGKEQEELLTQFAVSEGISVSELVRNSVFEKIEDEMDIRVLDRRMNDAEVNGDRGKSLEEVILDLDL